MIFAVLTERVRWSVAFKTVVFLPMAISAFATGVTWRIMYQQDPNVGALNALARVAVDAVSSPGVLPSALPSTPTLTGTPSTGLVLKTPLQPGGVAKLGLTGIAPTAVPKNAKQAVVPASKPGDIVGVVWRDFKPGGGKPGVVERQELGLPGRQGRAAVERRQGGPARHDRHRRDVRLHQGAGGHLSGGGRQGGRSPSRSPATPGSVRV